MRLTRHRQHLDRARAARNLAGSIASGHPQLHGFYEFLDDDASIALDNGNNNKLGKFHLGIWMNFDGTNQIISRLGFPSFGISIMNKLAGY